MQDLLSKIEEHKNKLNILLKNTESVKVLDKWLKSELSYTSNAIEGNGLTRRETVLVIEENITSSAKPFVFYQEAINHAKAFERILEIVQDNIPVTEKEILHLHKLLLTGIDDNNAGFYRNTMVRISGSRVVFPNPVKVSYLMTDFFNWLDSADSKSPLTAIEAHYKFVTIHPFADGNGRCGRLLMNLLLLKMGYSPVIIRPIDRKRYLDNIEKGQLSEELASYNLFMLHALERSLKTAIDIVDTTKEVVKPENLLTIAKFAKLANLPVSTIRYWVKIGKLEPYSHADSGYMLFRKEQVNELKPEI